jgi:hypothetical protein
MSGMEWNQYTRYSDESRGAFDSYNRLRTQASGLVRVGWLVVLAIAIILLVYGLTLVF